MSRTTKRLTIATVLSVLAFAAAAHAASPRWAFSPSTYDFGVRAPRSGPSLPKAFTLTNTGNETLSPTWTGLNWSGAEGTDPELFTITSDNCGTLAPGASCTIEVAFNPSTPGPKQGTLTVADVEPSPGGASASAYMEGTGAGQVVSLLPASLMFGPLEAGAGPSLSKAVSVTNEGQLDLTISSVSLVNYRHFDDDQFQLTGGTCAPKVVVSPGGTCTVRIAFVPTAASVFSADVRIVDNAPNSPQFATVEGNGIAPHVRSRPPKAFIFRHPNKLTTQRRAVFGFNGTATAVRFECKLDSRPFVPCESPMRFLHLRVRRHRFAVRAVDGNGHASPDAARYQWLIEAR